jgi:hypothetical protein
MHVMLSVTMTRREELARPRGLRYPSKVRGTLQKM